MRYHINQWHWGRTCVIITNDATGKVELSFSDNNPGVCFLSGLSVLPLERRKGIATQLLKEAISFCANCGTFRIDLSAIKKPFVIQFYEKLGFTQLKEYENEIPMYKLLK